MILQKRFPMPSFIFSLRDREKKSAGPNIMSKELLISQCCVVFYSVSEKK